MLNRDNISDIIIKEFLSHCLIKLMLIKLMLIKLMMIKLMMIKIIVSLYYGTVKLIELNKKED